MQLKDLIREHARQLGGGPLALDGYGSCHLMVNDNHLVTLEEVDDRSFFLHSQVVALPAQGNEEVFKSLLQANLYCRATQGCVLALDAQGTNIVLFRELQTAATDFAVYLATFEAFIHQLGYWKELLQGPQNQQRPLESHKDHRESGKWIKS